MKHRYYFDTSVFGGIFDNEFKEYTIQLFDQVKAGRVICVYSDIVEEELQAAPKHVIKMLHDLAHKQKIFSNSTAEQLANEYVQHKVVGETSYNDCVHIALATMFDTDAIVSWNFKHIVNEKRIPGYNFVNLKYGYNEIDILSPNQIITNGLERNGK